MISDKCLESAERMLKLCVLSTLSIDRGVIAGIDCVFDYVGKDS